MEWRVFGSFLHCRYMGYHGILTGLYDIAFTKCSFPGVV